MLRDFIRVELGETTNGWAANTRPQIAKKFVETFRINRKLADELLRLEYKETPYNGRDLLKRKGTDKYACFKVSASSSETNMLEESE